MTITSAPPGRSETEPRPLEAARAHLQRALTTRLHAAVAPPGGAGCLDAYPPAPGWAGTVPGGPLVVPLGAADTLGDGRADPYAKLRPRANVHLSSSAVLIGPWGGDSEDEADQACGQCLAMRWQRLRSRSEREALELGHTPKGAVAWPALTEYAVDAVWSAWSAVYGTGGAPGTVRSRAAEPADRALPQVTRIDLTTLTVLTVPLLPEPLCPHCARTRPGTAEAARMRLGPAPKPDPDSYRLHPLDSFELPTVALANPVCGALGGGTWINPASTTTAPVAGSNFVRGYAGLNDVTWSGQASAYATSRRLAFLEGLERYAGTHRRRADRPVLASYAELSWARESVLDPERCGFYDPRTYAEDPMVDPFDPEREIPWVWGYSLRDLRPILVPARLVHYSAGVAADNFVFECSNGCATGGSLAEAVFYALLELIERDAFLLAWHGRPRLTEIDLDTCRSAAVRSLRDRAGLHGYDVRAFDTRMDLSVPVITGLAVRRDGGEGTLSFGAAAGFDPEGAVEGALSEVLTYIPHLPYQVAERRAELEAMADDYGQVKHLKDHAQLHGLPRMAEHSREFLEPAGKLSLDDAFADWRAARPRTKDLQNDLRFVVDELRRAGHDVIAVDQTAPEQQRMGLHTVSATVPGLLPLDFGWNRQRVLRMPRLRTALRRAGRRPDDLPDEAIKLVPHPFP